MRKKGQKSSHLWWSKYLNSYKLLLFFKWWDEFC